MLMAEWAPTNQQLELPGPIAPGRGKETLFRVTFRNQINHIAIADNKANMIININSIIISLIIAILGSGITLGGGASFVSQPALVIPLTFLMLTCLTSAVFSILAARPKIIKSVSKESPKSSILFFGNIADHEVDAYLDQMTGLLGSQGAIYETLTIEVYNQGKILTRKYLLLRISYTLFMIGLIGGVLSFLLLYLVWT